MNYSKTIDALSSALGIRRLMKSAADLELADALRVIGLERKPSALARILPAIGLVVVSAAVGVGTALVLAPSSGRKLRTRLSDEIESAKHHLSDRISEFEHRSNGSHALS